MLVQKVRGARLLEMAQLVKSLLATQVELSEDVSANIKARFRSLVSVLGKLRHKEIQI